MAGRPSTAHESQELRTAAGNDPRIRLYLGYVLSDDVQIYLNASDAMTLPFRDTVNSGSVRLGMSFGLCCIAPRLGSRTETLGTGILYNSTDPHGLRQELELAADNKELLHERAEATYARARSVTWEDVGCRTYATYVGSK